MLLLHRTGHNSGCDSQIPIRCMTFEMNLVMHLRVQLAAYRAVPVIVEDYSCVTAICLLIVSERSATW